MLFCLFYSLMLMLLQQAVTQKGNCILCLYGNVCTCILNFAKYHSVPFRQNWDFAFSASSSRLLPLLHVYNMQTLFCQDKHSVIWSLKSQNFIFWFTKCHNILGGMSNPFFRLLVNINMPCTITQCRKGHVWRTSRELSISFGCLNITKCIKSAHVCPIIISFTFSLGHGLPEKSINIMSYTECSRKTVV